MENTDRRQVLCVKFDYTRDVISMFKMNHTTVFHGISVLQYTRLRVRTKRENPNPGVDSIVSHSSRKPWLGLDSVTYIENTLRKKLLTMHAKYHFGSQQIDASL